MTWTEFFRLGCQIARYARYPSFAVLLTLSQAAAHAAGPAVPDSMAQRLVACTVCHGKEGRATNDGYFPRIAGKPAGYLFNQLQNFRDGRRNNPAMAALVEHLPDSYLHDIAEYFSQLDLPYPAAQKNPLNAAQNERARVLVQLGDAARQIPACTLCHGTALTGMTPGYPGLLGLPRDYLVAQLGAWQTDQRRAHAPDCMGQIARQLNPDEVALLASWLSAQPVPDAAKPVSATGRTLPAQCGSGLKQP